jgi:hypothetical protein
MVQLITGVDYRRSKGSSVRRRDVGYLGRPQPLYLLYLEYLLDIHRRVNTYLSRDLFLIGHRHGIPTVMAIARPTFLLWPHPSTGAAVEPDS